MSCRSFEIVVIGDFASSGYSVRAAGIAVPCNVNVFCNVRLVVFVASASAISVRQPWMQATLCYVLSLLQYIVWRGSIAIQQRIETNAAERGATVP